MLTARAATPFDVGRVAASLRPEDIAEIRAASGLGPFEGVWESFTHTELPMVGVDEQDEPVCIGGVVPGLDPSVGVVWALTTTDLERHRVSFLRRSIPWVKRWQEQYPILTNCVDERNTIHIQWLRWLGFVFINRHPAYGHERRPFLEFVRINPLV